VRARVPDGDDGDGTCRRQAWRPRAWTSRRLANADPKNYRPILDLQIKAWAASVGRREGFEYGEEFRRTRFGGVERWGREFGAELADDV